MFDSWVIVQGILHWYAQYQKKIWHRIKIWGHHILTVLWKTLIIWMCSKGINMKFISMGIISHKSRGPRDIQSRKSDLGRYDSCLLIEETYSMLLQRTELEPMDGRVADFSPI